MRGLLRAPDQRGRRPGLKRIRAGTVAMALAGVMLVTVGVVGGAINPVKVREISS